MALLEYFFGIAGLIDIFLKRFLVDYVQTRSFQGEYLWKISDLREDLWVIQLFLALRIRLEGWAYLFRLMVRISDPV